MKKRKNFENTCESINRLQNEYDGLQWKDEILQQKYQQEKEECNILDGKYQNILLDINQKKTLKTLILNKSIKQINAEIEKQDINFNEIFHSMNIKQSSINNIISTKLDDVIKVKDETVKHLETKAIDIKHQYYHMIAYYENLMNKYNIPISELGFIPKQI